MTIHIIEPTKDSLKGALAFFTLLVDLRITQLVNRVRSAHAILTHDVLDDVGHK